MYRYGANITSHSRAINLNAHKFSSTKSLPKKYDLRNNQCSPYFDSFNQLNSNSCTSQSVSASIMCINRKIRSDLAFVPSPYFNYYYSRYIDGTQKSNQGTSLKSSLQSAVNGISNIKYWSNKQSLFNTPNKISQLNSLNHNVKKYKSLHPTILNLKKCITSGYPFIFSFWITSFMDKWFQQKPIREESDYILQIGNVNKKSNKIAGHACLCIGYDDTKYHGVFIIRNSWGNLWGDEGHFYIKYSDMINPFFTNEFYIIMETCNKKKCVGKCPTYYDICS
jgi:hypothetical protein